jgi:hypothetical protein
MHDFLISLYIPLPPQRHPKGLIQSLGIEVLTERSVLNNTQGSVNTSIARAFNSVLLGVFEVEGVYSAST